MKRPKVPQNQPGDITHDHRMALAVDKYQSQLQNAGKSSTHGITNEYRVNWETLRSRVVRGAGSREAYAQSR